MNFIGFLLFIKLILANPAGDNNDTLPVELYYFKAQIFTNHVLLTWGTATEIDNYGFNLERSTNVNDWIKLEFLPGYGTSNIPRDYSYEDTTVTIDSIYYYRLKQIDIIGSFTYSDTISIHFITQVSEFRNTEIPRLHLYQNYPNPFNPVTKIRFEIIEKGNTDLSIFDLLGNEITKLVNKELQPGTYEVEFNSSLFPELSAGVYFYKLTSSDFINTKKIILLK